MSDKTGEKGAMCENISRDLMDLGGDGRLLEVRTDEFVAVTFARDADPQNRAKLEDLLRWCCG